MTFDAIMDMSFRSVRYYKSLKYQFTVIWGLGSPPKITWEPCGVLDQQVGSMPMLSQNRRSGVRVIVRE